MPTARAHAHHYWGCALGRLCPSIHFSTPRPYCILIYFFTEARLGGDCPLGFNSTAKSHKTHARGLGVGQTRAGIGACACVLARGAAVIRGLGTSPIHFPGLKKKQTGALPEGKFAALLGISGKLVSYALESKSWHF